MSDKQNETLQDEEQLTKSIDALIEDIFCEDEVVETPVVEKSIDIAKDAKTKADDAVNQAPKMQNDDSRGAGRPKQISDVPQNDMDGKREGQYDGSIAAKQSEDEPEETKQSESMDQTQEKNRIGGKAKSPQSAPFKKSLTDEEYEEYMSLKKASEDKKSEEVKAEELKKAETARKQQEDLVKSTVAAATDDLRKSLTEVLKKNEEQATLIKAMASQPVRAKSITGIEQLEKSMAPEDKSEETFSKSEVADAILELAKSKKISEDALYEYEMTGRISNQEARRVVERHLEGK